MNTKLITIALTLVVGIILAGSVLMPVLNSATEKERTFTNQGYFTYDAVNENTDLTIDFDPATPGVITIGEKTVTMPEENGNWTICGSENFTVRYVKTASSTNLQCYGSNGYIAGDPSATTTVLHVDVDATEMTFERNTSTTKTYSMGTHGFVINTDGNGALMLKYANEKAYVLGDSEVYLCGTTFVTGSGTNDFVGVFGYGSLDDGLTMNAFYGTGGGQNTISFGDVTATYEAVNGFNDLYQVDKFEFPLTQNSATVTATYSYFVVPTEVTAERTAHLTDGQIALMGAIPVLVIVALLVVAVGVVARRND